VDRGSQKIARPSASDRALIGSRYSLREGHLALRHKQTAAADPVALVLSGSRHVAQTSVGVVLVTPLLLIVYLVGAVCTAWRLSISTVSRKQRPFFNISSVIWPLTVAVFGLLILLALLADWFDRLAVVLAEQRADLPNPLHR
jgi:hypothetical protein